MTKINVEQLTKDMALAAKGTFGAQWPEIREFAKSEMKLIAEGIVTINKLYALKQVSKQLISQHLTISNALTQTAANHNGLILPHEAV